jgi:uncharacterized integral membrane protein
MWHQVKIVSLVILALLVFILILQNTEQQKVDFLFWPITMPLAALLFVAMLLGFAIGILVSGRMLFRRRKVEKP